MTEHSLEICSFCGKHKDKVSKLIVGEHAAICNQCVDLCQTLLTDSVPPEPEIDKQQPDPQAIKEFLDQHIVGQEQAKIVISVAVVNHYKRINPDKSAPELDKANILLIGPTGSGKTLISKTIAKFLDVPFAMADATSLTEAGYVGDDVETLISRLYANAEFDLAKTQQGIVFIDEIDKISRKSENASITRDVSGEGVQQALLKLIEGTVCRISPGNNRKHPQGETVEVDTSNILFIAGGAFVGLDHIVEKRHTGTSMGFASHLPDQKAGSYTANTDDLVRFGMIPELVGRFPVAVHLNELTKQDMSNILTKVKNNLPSQYKWLFAQDNIDLDFTESALATIVDRAMTAGTGARALQSELERALLPHMYHAKTYQDRGLKCIVIDADHINTPTEF